MLGSLLDALGPKPLIRDKTPQERDAENAWWATLSQEQKDAHLKRWQEEDARDEAFRLAVVGLVLAAFIVYPMTMVFLHMMGWATP